MRFAIDTLPDLEPAARSLVDGAEFLFVLVFTLEYAIRLLREEKSLRYALSFFGIIDILAIAPYYITALLGLQPLRLLVLFRLLRILKLTRYLTALRRFTRALHQTREELVIFFAASTIIIFLSAVGIYHFEHQVQPDAFRNFFDALWWSVVTLTTVGGRLFTFVVLFTGLGLIAYRLASLHHHLIPFVRNTPTKIKTAHNEVAIPGLASFRAFASLRFRLAV